MTEYFLILLLTHNAVNNTAPEYLCDLIRLRVRLFVHLHPCLLCVPPISKMCANSFMYAAPTPWNALDLDIRLLPFDVSKKEFRHIFN